MSVFRDINIRIETCHHVYLQCPTIVEKKVKNILNIFGCEITLELLECTPAWIILHPRTLRIRTHSPTTRKVSSCKTRCSLAKGLRNVWNNATGNNAECPLFVWCLLNNLFGINSLMFHVCSTGRGWILMASNVIHCKLHCYHHLFACAPQTTLRQASPSQTHWLGDWQRFLQSADGSTLDPVSHGRTTLFGGLGERNLRYSMI